MGRLTIYKSNKIFLYSSKNIEPLIKGYEKNDASISLEEIRENQERYKLFLYNASYIKEDNWTQFVWVFDMETSCREYLSRQDVSLLKEMFNPFELENL